MILEKESIPSLGIGGRPLLKRRVPGFQIEEVTYSARQILARHSHPFPVVSMLLKGTFLEQWDKGTTDRRPGRVLFQPIGEPHSDCVGASPATLVGVVILPETAQRLRERELLPGSRVEVRSQHLAYLESRLVAGLTDHDAAGDLSLEGIALELLGALLKKQGSQQRRRAPLERAVTLLRDRFREPISLGTVAQEVGLSPVRLAQEFRRQHKMTVGEYLRQVRLDYARAQLASSSISIIDLAYELGFADHSHFSHTFKRYVGVSPRQFRDAHRR